MRQGYTFKMLLKTQRGGGGAMNRNKWCFKRDLALPSQDLSFPWDWQCVPRNRRLTLGSAPQTSVLEAADAPKQAQLHRPSIRHTCKKKGGV